MGVGGGGGGGGGGRRGGGAVRGGFCVIFYTRALLFPYFS